MEEVLHERVIGQEKAVQALADAIAAHARPERPAPPIGSFIFLGSSGVGKTELAKALAEFMFDDEDALIRIDMSEYREQHTTAACSARRRDTSAMKRAASHGSGTRVVPRRPVRRNREGASDVWNALLQILEDGRMTDGQGAPWTSATLY